MPCLMEKKCSWNILNKGHEINSKFSCYICSVKIHQKILLIFALAGLLSAGFTPADNVVRANKYAESHHSDEFVFDVPEPFLAALLEQSRVPFASQKLPTTYFKQYEPTVALITLPLQLAIDYFPSLQFVSESASFALGDFHQNILFPFHFFG